MSATYTPLLKVNEPKEFNTNVNPVKPPIQPLLMNNVAPLATTETTKEIDEVDADHDEKPPTSVKGVKGMDDGFFDEKSSFDDTIKDTKHKDEPTVPNFEIEIPTTPDADEVPSITLRFGEDDDATNKTAAADGSKDDEDKNINANRNLLTPTPNFGIDFETGSVLGSGESIPDVNIYQHKKTLAQGMMDLALFSANANQLRYVLESNRHPYYYPSVVLISFSLVLQVAVGIGLIWNATYNVKDKKEICIANKINNFTVIGIFLVTVINVFISAFGVGNIQQ